MIRFCSENWFEFHANFTRLTRFSPLQLVELFSSSFTRLTFPVLPFHLRKKLKICIWLIFKYPNRKCSRKQIQRKSELKSMFLYQSKLVQVEGRRLTARCVWDSLSLFSSYTLFVVSRKFSERYPLLDKQDFDIFYHTDECWGSESEAKFTNYNEIVRKLFDRVGERRKAPLNAHRTKEEITNFLFSLRPII